MKVKSLENALKKAGYEIKIDISTYNNGSIGHSYRVTTDKNELTWYRQGDNVTCLHSRGIDDHSDIMTDYFAGWFPKTIKSAIASLSW